MSLTLPLKYYFYKTLKKGNVQHTLKVSHSKGHTLRVQITLRVELTLFRSWSTHSTGTHKSMLSKVCVCVWGGVWIKHKVVNGEC